MREHPESVTTAAQTNDRYRTLVALRDTLARSIDNCESLRDLAALSARLSDVLQQIENVPNRSEVSAADEIAARRLSRRSGSPSQARA